jgi:hypothetical protein
MIYDLIVLTFGFTFGVIATKTGYADLMIIYLYNRYLEHEKKEETLFQKITNNIPKLI